MLPDKVTSFSFIIRRPGVMQLCPISTRFVAGLSPVQGQLQIKGTLSHGTDNGDGIRLSMISSRQRTFG